ncbi:hypothetical protein [Brevibacillus fulvus]|uniref:2-keto-3-deoxygluconate kinase n=1 Tax=Brevibacillus fulvus TaxID=1125967 RepID=A0A939BTB2_9BACL|nr:hypothetical protein [Brevibacillus fulvus]MBM7591333.1 hypothetical protein [Brevibacillus fulvus]
MREGKDESRELFGHRGHWEQWQEKAEKRRAKICSEPRYQSAQTFRRGRAIAFLEILKVKRATLQQQLNQPEYESIKQVISGELKAVEAIIQEFMHAFELREISMQSERENKGDE